VLNSALGAGDYESLFPLAPEVEDNLKASGIEFVICGRMGSCRTFCAFLREHKAQGAFYVRWGCETSLVDLRDVAAVAAMALTSEGHANENLRVGMDRKR